MSRLFLWVQEVQRPCELLGKGVLKGDLTVCSVGFLVCIFPWELSSGLLLCYCEKGVDEGPSRNARIWRTLQVACLCETV